MFKIALVEAVFPGLVLTSIFIPGVAMGQGQVVGWGDSAAGSLSPGSSSLLRFTQLAAGQHGTLALRQDGTLASWGDTFEDVPPAATAGAVRIAAGLFHGLALKPDGSVVGWGYDNSGQARPPSGLGPVASLDAGMDHSIAALLDGGVVCWGSDADGQCTVPAGVQGVARVSAGVSHSMALTASGSIACWGSNLDGECDVPPTLSGALGIDAGYYHSIAWRGDGTIWCWGWNSEGQCDVPAGVGGVAMVRGGFDFTVALRSDGTVRCWGSNGFGQREAPEGLDSVIEVAAGNWHAVALKSDGSVACWGSRDYGQQAVPQTLGPVVQMASGTSHSVAVTDGGTVRGWGASGFGQASPPAGLAGVISLAAGDYHSMALTQDGRIICSGFDGAAQTLVPSTLGFVTRIAAGTDHSLAVQGDGRLVGWGANGFGQCLGTTASGNPIAVGTTGQQLRLGGVVITDAVEVDGGDRFSAILRSGGVVACWGLDDFGQTSVPSGLGPVSRIALGNAHVVAIDADGSITCWGRSDLEQCAVPPGLGPVQDVAVGAHHNVALRPDGSVRCWGLNGSGQCDIPGNLGPAAAVSAGGGSSFVILRASASSCANPAGSGNAQVAVSGSLWQDIAIWSWSGGDRQVPGVATHVDLGSFGSVGSTCDANAATLTTGPGTSLLVPSTASALGEDQSIRVTGTANLAGRLWLLGVSGVSTTLPADLSVPVLSAGSVNGFFDLIQTEVPPPAGKFLALVPEDVAGRTVLSLRLLDIQTGGSLSDDAGVDTYPGRAVAAATIDLNMDGFDDLALAVDVGVGQPGQVVVLINDGLGNLGARQSVVESTVASAPTSIATGDVDGDGKPDVVVGLAGDGTARVFQNDGSGLNLVPGTVISGFAGSPTSVLVVPPSTGSVASNSVRGKFRVRPPGNDVAVGTSGGKMHFYSSVGTETQVAISLDGSADAMARRSGSDGVQGTDIATGGVRSTTFDGLLASETGYVSVIRDQGNGYVVQQTMNITAKPRAIDMADIDGDGSYDIVSANAEPQLPAAGGALPVLSIFRNRSTGFAGGVPYQPTGASSGLDVSLIDVDGDGDRDIVSVHRKVGSDSEAALLRVDTLGPGTPISVGAITVLEANDPILSERGNLDGAGGEDLFLVVEPQSPTNGFAPPGAFVQPLLSRPDARPGDLDGNGVVDSGDLGLLLLMFGTPDPAADLDGSGTVDSGDLGLLLLLFG